MSSLFITFYIGVGVGLRKDDGASAIRGSLVHLNDEGHTFAAIADFIESEPRGLLE
jgi:hypothetical protein